MRIISSSILVAITLSLVSCNAADTKEGQVSTDDLVYAKYFYPTITQGYEVERTIFGVLEARHAYELKAEVGGQVTSVDVDRGAVVASGMRLAKIDIVSTKLRQEGVHERLVAAEIDLDAQQKDLERYRQLLEKGFVSQSRFQTLTATVAATQSRVQDLRKTIESSDYDNTRATLTAPVGGLISRKYINQGDLVSPGSPAFRIIPQNDFDARFSIPLYMKDRFSVGDTVALVLADASLNGTIRSIAPDIDETLQTFTISVTLPPTDTPQFQGQGISLDVTQRVDREGFWVHRASLVSGLDGAMAVQVASDPVGEIYSARRLNVKVHHLDDDRAFVSGTVTGKDAVLSVGSHLVYPGQSFRLGEEAFGP